MKIRGLAVAFTLFALVAAANPALCNACSPDRCALQETPGQEMAHHGMAEMAEGHCDPAPSPQQSSPEPSGPVETKGCCAAWEAPQAEAVTLETRVAPRKLAILRLSYNLIASATCFNF